MPASTDALATFPTRERRSRQLLRISALFFEESLDHFAKELKPPLPLRSGWSVEARRGCLLLSGVAATAEMRVTHAVRHRAGRGAHWWSYPS